MQFIIYRLPFLRCALKVCLYNKIHFTVKPVVRLRATLQCRYFDWQFAPSKLRAQISTCCLVQLVFRENSVVKAAVVHYNNISIRQDWIPHMVYSL